MSKKGSIEIIRNSELDDYLKSGLGNISPEHKNGKDPKIQEGLPGTALGSINLDTAIIELLLKWKKIHKGNNPKTPDYLIIVNRERESNVRDKFLIVEIHEPSETEVFEKFKTADHFLHSRFPELNSFRKIKIFIPASKKASPSKNSRFAKNGVFWLKSLNIDEFLKKMES